MLQFDKYKPPYKICIKIKNSHSSSFVRIWERINSIEDYENENKCNVLFIFFQLEWLLVGFLNQAVNIFTLFQMHGFVFLKVSYALFQNFLEFGLVGSKSKNFLLILFWISLNFYPTEDINKALSFQIRFFSHPLLSSHEFPPTRIFKFSFQFFPKIFFSYMVKLYTYILVIELGEKGAY